MSNLNQSTVWGQWIVDELVTAGVGTVCVTPGSRSTPLTVACVDHPDLDVYTHVDERSSAFFALGHARRTGSPVGLVCTSGTAAANFHPAVIEADTGRVPLVVLTADRPPELRDSGANQTIDQVDLYGDAVRYHADLPVADGTDRSLRSVRRTVAVAVAAALDDPAGPVHLNCPFRKPLAPTPDDAPVPVADRDAPFVRTALGSRTPESESVDRLGQLLADASRPLVVAGPADPAGVPTEAVGALSNRLDVPVFADPASGLRFGRAVEVGTVCGGYDTYAPTLEPPDIVVRLGAAPTSKRLRQWLEAVDAPQVLVDTGLEWREGTFTATDLVVGSPTATLERVATTVSRSDGGWLETIQWAESQHWERVSEAGRDFEGAVVANALAEAPPGGTVTVSNSTPIRDADRFARPRSEPLSVIANRGASGIDGVTSTALGATVAGAGPGVLVTGDLAFYHDATGLAGVRRFDIDITIVVIDNGGGGIFHMLPIAEFDPPFTEHFTTPIDVDLEELCRPFDLPCDRTDTAGFRETYQQALEQAGPRVVVVDVDAPHSHRRRAGITDAVCSAISGTNGPPDRDGVAKGDPKTGQCDEPEE